MHLKKNDKIKKKQIIIGKTATTKFLKKERRKRTKKKDTRTIYIDTDTQICTDRIIIKPQNQNP